MLDRETTIALAEALDITPVINSSDSYVYQFTTTPIPLDIAGRQFFDGLSLQDKLDMMVSCRLFSMHFDGYYRSACQNLPHPQNKLMQHFHWRVFDENCWQSPHFTFLGIPVVVNLVPFKGIDTIDEFKERIDILLRSMHSVFVRNPFPLPTPVSVFRGLLIPIGSMVRLTLVGLTSFTTALSYALQFAATKYGNDDINCTDRKDRMYNQATDESVIIEVVLPKEAHTIPMNILTIQNEYELCLMGTHTLQVESTEVKTVQSWNSIIGHDGTIIPPPAGIIKYTLLKCHLVLGSYEMPAFL